MMSLNGLFRKEAVEHQRARLWGDVILVQPISYLIIAGVVAMIMIAAVIFLTSQNYVRKESVRGYLVPDAGVVRVFADQGGVLEKLYLEAGQEVRKGDPIALVKLERLSTTGESSGEEVLASVRRDLASVEKRLDESHKQQEKETKGLKGRIIGFKAEYAAMQAELTLLDERIELASKQYDAALELSQKGYAAERLVDERHNVVLNTLQAKTGMARQIVGIENTIKDAENSLSLLPFHFEEERANLTSRKESLVQQLVNLEQVKGYTITASVDGIVSGVLVAEGGSVRPNLPLMTIRPSGARLLAQLLVPSRAIGLIEAGQAAKIQYDAFPYQRFGIFDGEVQKVSGSILTPADLPTPVVMQEAFYVVEVNLDHQSIDVGGKPVPLKAGMVLKADITLENRTLVQWMLDPIFSVTGKL